jgi:hypothetical protein
MGAILRPQSFIECMIVIIIPETMKCKGGNPITFYSRYYYYFNSAAYSTTLTVNELFGVACARKSILRLVVIVRKSFERSRDSI